MAEPLPNAARSAPRSALERLDKIDRRWIFLSMALAIAVPILWVDFTGKTLPEKPTIAVYGAFNAIETLPPGSKVFVSFDFDPASAGELQPMATSIIHHCAMRGLRIYGATLWAPGSPLIGATFEQVLGDYPDYKYGVNMVDLGYQAGNEGVMKQVNTGFRTTFPNDSKGTPLSQIPMMEGIQKIADFDAMVSISAGSPGAKEWIQFSISPTLTSRKPLRFVAGATGVQTPQLIPYYPVQLAGVLGAIKGAAEYEFLVNEAATKLDPKKPIPPKYLEAQRRMAPQTVAHSLMVVLIALGNIIFFAARAARRKAAGA